MESFWKPRPTADTAAEEPKKSKSSKEPKEPKEEAEPPREDGAKPVPSAGSKRGEPPAPAGGENGKTLFKRRRTSAVEEHEFVICEPGVKVDFPAPEGATGGKAVITWSFD